jgi:RNA polymerase sigma-70 factor, ECF subfamily
VKAERQNRFRATASTVTPAVAAYLARRQYPLSKTDLEDLVEEVLIIVWRRLEDIPEGAEIPWSIGVARNVRRNAVRKFSNGLAATSQLRPATDTASAEDVFIADEGVRSALAALHDDDRDLLLLHFWDGLGAAEIATIFGVSANAAAVRLSRAQERFRRHFEISNVG